MRDKTKDACDEIAGQCLFGRVRHLTRRLTAIYDDAVRDLGLTGAQLNLLVIIGRTGPVPMKKLAQIMGMSPSTASRNLERMVANGWLCCTPGSDARTQLVDLDDTGRSLIVEALPRWKAAQRKTVKLLGAEEAANLRALVNRIRT